MDYKKKISKILLVGFKLLLSSHVYYAVFCGNHCNNNNDQLNNEL